MESRLQEQLEDPSQFSDIGDLVHTVHDPNVVSSQSESQVWYCTYSSRIRVGLDIACSAECCSVVYLLELLASNVHSVRYR